jgi:hypothetical protein
VELRRLNMPATHPPTTKHNYEVKREKLIQEGEIKPGEVKVLHVYHDEWCDFHSGGFCNCDPDLVVERLESIVSPN